MRRAAAALAVLVGAVLIVGTLAVDAFGAAASGERLLDGAQPAMRDDVSQLRRDYDLVADGTEQTFDEVLPTLARATGVSTSAFVAGIKRDYPSVGELIDRQEEVITALDRTVTNLEAHADDFRAAEDLPAPGVSLEVGPVALLLAGGALLAAGALLWRRGGWPIWLLAVIGIVLAVPPLAFSAPQNSARAKDLLESLNLSEQVTASMREQLEVADRAVDELRGRLVPDLADRLGVGTDDLVAGVTEQFPAAGEALRGIDDALARIERDLRFREQNVDEFADVEDLPLVAMVWMIVVAGAALVVVAGIALIRDRRKAERLL